MRKSGKSKFGRAQQPAATTRLLAFALDALLHRSEVIEVAYKRHGAPFGNNFTAVGTAARARRTEVTEDKDRKPRSGPPGFC